MRGLLGQMLAIGADPGDDEDTRPARPISVKGRSQPVEAYAITGLFA